MTGIVIKPAVRRAASLAASTAVLVASTALLAGPASADTPEGWEIEPSIDGLFVLGVMVGVPVALFLLITAAVYLPSLVRGERVAPGATGPEDQWLGGRRSAGEIAYTPAPAEQGSDAAAQATQAVETDGGASARW